MNDTSGPFQRRRLLAGVAAVAWATVPGHALAACPALNPYAIFPDAGGACGVASIGTAAAKVASTQPLAFTGDATGSGTLGGGGFALTLPNLLTPGSGPRVTVNAKGQVTAINTLTAADIATGQGFTAYPNTNPAGYVTAATAGVTSVGGLTGVIAAAQLAPTMRGTSPTSLASGSAALGSAYAADYGAVADNASHTVSATLGLSTIAAIVAYTNASGAHPYAWLTNTAGANWNYYSHLFTLGNVPTGQTQIIVPSAVGVPNGAGVSNGAGSFAPNTTVASSSTLPPVATTVTSGAAGTPTLVLGSTNNVFIGDRVPTVVGVPANTTVIGVAPATNTLTLSANLTVAAIAGVAFNLPSRGQIVLSAATVGPINNDLTGTGQTTAYGGGSNVNWLLNFSLPLTDAQAANAEMCWLAIQSAIQATGRATAPFGRCVMVNAANVGSGLGTLVLPSASTNVATAPGSPVDLVGVGETMAVLSYPTDLGVGRMAIVTGSPDATWANGLGRYSTTANFSGTISDLTITGPGDNVGSPGVRAVWMAGAAIGSQRDMARVNVRGFGDGVETVGDGQTWIDTELRFNFNDIRFASANKALSGNMEWRHVVLGNARNAAVAVSRNAVMFDVHATKLSIDSVPYAFLLEAGASDNYGGPYTAFGINAVSLPNAKLTNLGNAVVLDDDATRADGTNAGAKTRSVATLLCDPCTVAFGGGGYNAAIVTDGRGPYHAFDVHLVGNLALRNMPYGSLLPPAGMVSWLDADAADAAGGAIFEGHAGTFGNLTVPILSGAILNPYAHPDWAAVKVGTPGVQVGHVEYLTMGAATQAYVGQVVEQNTGSNATAGSLLGTASANGIKGVVIQPLANANGVGLAVVTAGEGVPVLGPPTGVFPGTWLKKVAGGVTAVATGPTDVGVVGFTSGFGLTGSVGPGAAYTTYPVHLCIGGQ